MQTTCKDVSKDNQMCSSGLPGMSKVWLRGCKDPFKDTTELLTYLI